MGMDSHEFEAGVLDFTLAKERKGLYTSSLPKAKTATDYSFYWFLTTGIKILPLALVGLKGLFSE
jgi:hypothetical protein